VLGQAQLSLLPFITCHGKIHTVNYGKKIYLFKEVNFLANTKSAEKRIEINRRNALRNAAIKSQVKTSIKKFEATINEGNLVSAVKNIDKAVTKGVLHKNTAANKKSRLQKKYNNTIGLH
jgi:small subunit ribosomal protein S20